ncbi:MAG: sugar phosphate isomerase/epimerase [Actinobacteria bacterium]|nr:sugar phosphate isomerase/epimerase [Actinomycetota bacterium]
MFFKDYQTDIGVVSFMAYPEIIKDEQSAEEKIKKLVSDEFFSFIEIAHINDEEIRKNVKKILEISNIRIGFDAHTVILSNNLSINDRDNDKRQEAVKILKELIDEAYYMGSEGFTILSGFKPDINNIEHELILAVDSVKVLCDYSIKKSNELNKKPIDIIIETFDDKEYAKNRLIGPTKMAVEFAKEIRADFENFGLVLDLSHLPILGENFDQSLKQAREFIKLIHIGNCIIKNKNHPAFGDNHPRFCIDGGENNIDVLASFIKSLIGINYFKVPGNTLILEVKPLSDEDSDVTVAGSKRALLAAISRL